MMRGNKQSIGTLLIASACALLLCTPAASLASVDDEPIGSAHEVVMEASGGLTLGSVVLIAMAGVVVTFGRAKADAGDGSGATTFKLGNQQAAVHGRLQGDQQ